MAYKIINFPLTMPMNGRESTVYPTLLRDEQNAILVDCGFSGALPYLEQELQKIGLTAAQLTGLVLTHHDHDHMGAAAELKKLNPNMKIYAHEQEEPYISGKEKSLRLRQAEELQKKLPPEQQEFGRNFSNTLRQVEPVNVDVFVSDDEQMGWCEGCRIIYTPGHMPGHISVFMEKDRIVITGDAIVMEDGKPIGANPQYTLDMETANKSIEKLQALNPKVYYCYHGGPYEVPAEEA